MRVSSIGRAVRRAMTAGVVWSVALPAVGVAAPTTTTTTTVLPGVPRTLPEVIGQAQIWVMGILAAAATLFLVIGGARYVVAGGDPGEVEKAKQAIKSALVGYALAFLAPVILTVLRGIVGG